MDGPTLSKAMGGTLPAARYAALAPAVTKALAQADCTTINRAAMFLAQVGHESAGLRYMEEIASGAAYEGRVKGLGNTQPGDGRRFKGRGPLQVTGRANYTSLSKWAHSKGYVPTATYFVDNPEKLASIDYGFLGAVWYWTVARPTLNARSDAGDIVAATRLINGGTNGLADRRNRWARCRGMGAALLPDKKPAATKPVTPPAKPAATKPAAPRVLRTGCQGSDVRALKAGLRTVFKKYAGGLAADDYYSANTSSVIREFQRRSSLSQDGVVGPKTRAALNKVGVKF